MIISEDGQMSVDFLLGISIFLLAFGFIIQFIPGLFITTSGDESLNSVAYRTAEILVADPGWWENQTHNGTDWEVHKENISRIGFAYDITPNTKQTLTPNILDKKKIQMALNLSNYSGARNQTMLRNKLGLYYKISNSQVDYGYNITIEQNGTIMVINNSELSFGEIQPISQDVFRIKRQVLVETGNITLLKADEIKNNSNNSVQINISGNQSEDVIIQITDFNLTTFNNASVNGIISQVPSNYSIKKRTNTSFQQFNKTETLNGTDTLRFVFNQSLFLGTFSTIELNFTNMTFFSTGPPYVEYANRTERLYEPATLIVEVWK
jgi:hypothetical protein